MATIFRCPARFKCGAVGDEAFMLTHILKSHGADGRSYLEQIQFQLESRHKVEPGKTQNEKERKLKHEEPMKTAPPPPPPKRPKMTVGAKKMPIPHNDEEEEETSGDSEEEIEQIEQDENHQDEESSGDEIVIQKQEKLKNVLGIETETKGKKQTAGKSAAGGGGGFGRNQRRHITREEVATMVESQVKIVAQIGDLNRKLDLLMNQKKV